ncbi:hypothetical protein TTRE_0000118301 [Trichuris trichiura]|uniref:MH2 domain-containing protein n=1 Tax=Trichuris trichiura TaxID=36087 RepID=A0A077YYM0_TRITR|nr:hypothetical protein TTRE_0000118301 [Trichuris trichiura]
MRAFKEAIDLEFSLPNPDEQKLLYKSAIRISLVKEESHPLKTPCWFMLVNIVAVDVLTSRVQAILPCLDILETLDNHQQKRRCTSRNSDSFGLQSSKQTIVKPLQSSTIPIFTPISTFQRPRSDLDIHSLNCLSQETPSTESGLEDEDDDNDSATEIISNSTVVLPTTVAPIDKSFPADANKSSKVRFNRHVMLSKARPRYWDAVPSSNRHSSYDSSLSSSHSFVSNGRSYSPSLLSDSLSETQTTDSGFQEAHSETCGQQSQYYCI